MKRRFLIVVFLFLTGAGSLSAQSFSMDDLFRKGDTTAIIDSLLADFDDYMDSIYARKSFFSVALTAGSGLFSYEKSNSVFFTTKRKLILSPMVGYYHKSGLGLTTSAYMIPDNKQLNVYQYAVTPSYDLIKKKYSAGMAYTRFFVKDSLNFFTTPIQNESFAYFSYKDWIVRPTISFSYGWGNHTSYEKKKIKVLKKRSKNSRSLYVIERTDETVRDISMIFSLKKDFNFHGLLSAGDYLSITPVVLLNMGTLQYGFNSTYSLERTEKIPVNILPSNTSLSDRSKFTAQSTAMILRSSYFIGNLMIQPQVIFDYYLPHSSEPLTTAFSLTAGMSF